jgi:hypothetical protein
MTTIFLSYTQADTSCAEQVRQELEAKGYNIWREPGYPGPADIAYPRMIENAILGSAAVVLPWSSHAVAAQEVGRQVAFAQQLKKPVLAVMLDTTALPASVTAAYSVHSQASCSDAVAQLLLHLPPVDSPDLLLQFWQKAAHENNPVRKEAIDLAAGMLQRGEHRDEVLAVLEYLTQHDLMSGVRDKAREVLDAELRQDVPLPFRPDEARHMVSMTCEKCWHVNYFDRRVVCLLKKDGWRAYKTQGSKKLDVLKLNCETCGKEAYVDVDCEGYR